MSSESGGFLWRRELGRLAILVVVGAMVGFVWNPRSLRSAPPDNGPKKTANFRPLSQTVAEAEAGFLSGELVILDARSRPEYEKAHLPGSYAAFGQGSRSLFRELRAWIPRRASILVIGSGGLDFAARRLGGRFRMMGYPNVSVLDGGMPAWRKAGLPVARGWDMQELLESEKTQ